jgi:hypothetical protein
VLSTVSRLGAAHTKEFSVSGIPRVIPAIALLISFSGCADAVGRAVEEVVRTSFEGVQELGLERPGAILAVGELRCEGPEETCEGRAGAPRACHVQAERLSVQFGEVYALCANACGGLEACFDEALAETTAGTSPSAESARCSDRLVACAVTSDACGALDVLTDEPLRSMVVECEDVPCDDLQRCLRDALLSVYDAEG